MRRHIQVSFLLAVLVALATGLFGLASSSGGPSPAEALQPCAAGAQNCRSESIFLDMEEDDTDAGGPDQTNGRRVDGGIGIPDAGEGDQDGVGCTEMIPANGIGFGEDDDGDGFVDEGCPILGMLQSCVEIHEDGVLNADEDTADRIEVDAVVDDIPFNASGLAGEMFGFSFQLNYSEAGDATPDGLPAQLRVNGGGAGSSDSRFLLFAEPNSGTTGTQELDEGNQAGATVDGTWTADDLDANTSATENGDGVLKRIRLESQPGGAPGIFQLWFGSGATFDGPPIVLDQANAAQFPITHTSYTANKAFVAISQDLGDAGTIIGDSAGELFTCPNAADVKKVGVGLGQSVTGVLNPLPAGTPDLFTITTTIHNNGPEDASITDYIDFGIIPADCTITPVTAGIAVDPSPDPNDYTFTVPPIGISTNNTFMLDFNLVCTLASAHNFTVSDCIQPNNLLGDLNQANNCDSDPVNFAVTAQQDLKLTQTLSGFPPPKCPALSPPTPQPPFGTGQIGCGVVLPFPPILPYSPVNFTANKVLHNNGPYIGPTNAAIGWNAFVSNAAGGGMLADTCAVTGPVPPQIVPTAGISTNVPVNENFSVTCNLDAMGNDNDGDTLIDEDTIDAGPAAVGAPETFPGDCNDTVDDDLDTVVNDGCPAIDNDADGSFNEDSGFLLPTVCVYNQATIATAHVTDPSPDNVDFIPPPANVPQPGNDGVGDNNQDLDCQTMLLERPFTPSFSVIQDEDDVPSDPATLPTDDDCLLTQPCEQNVSYAIPGTISETEPGSSCVDTADNNANNAVNEGCPQVGATSESGVQCLDAVDSDVGDADGVVNDGCPPVGGGQPLAGVITFTPGNGAPGPLGYYITRGIADPGGNGSTPNGTRAVQSSFSINIKFAPGFSPCSANVGSPPGGFPLFDRALPAAYGEGPDSGEALDLVNPGVWNTRNEASPLFRAFDPNGTAVAGGAPVWAAYTGLIPGLNSPATVVVFNLGPGTPIPGSSWASVLITGDPAAPVVGTSAQPCSPLTVGPAIYLGETAAESENNNYAYYAPSASEDGAGAGTCSNSIDDLLDGDADAADADCAGPTGAGDDCDDAIDDDLDTLINDGCVQVTSVTESGAGCANAVSDDDDNFDTVIDGDDVVNDGCPIGGPLALRDLRVCNEIKGGTGPADFHFIAGQFQRTDTGQQTLILDPNKCTAENDVEIDKTDDLTVTAPIDLTHTEPVNIAIQNGQVPGNVNVQVSLVGPAVCNPLLVPTPASGTKTADILTGPTIVGPNQSTVLNWTELAMAANELRNVIRNYTINCPAGGPYTFNIVVNASANFPDPDTSNNQDENSPVVTNGSNDVDGDGDPNASDNCPTVANPGQEDADNDGLGDACDDDDDNDGLDDVDDACDTAAEDLDGFDLDTDADTIPDAYDGCPDTDAGISYVTKETAYNVDVSTSNTKNVKTGVANQGNIVADLEVSLLLKSTAGVCEAHWIPQAGDGHVEDNIGGTLHSLLVVTLDNMLPGEVREISRNYTVHCMTKSLHDNAILFEAGVVPVFPVTEEDMLGAKPNVRKQWIDITAYAVADVKKLGMIVPDPPMQVGVPIDVTVRSVFHNNGPFGPVTVSDVINSVPPPGCTAVPDATPPLGAQDPFTNPTNVNLPVSVTVVLDQSFTLQCSQPSNHTFTWNDSITVTTVHVRDPNLANNSATFQLTNPVTAEADAEVTSVTTTSPVSVASGTNFNVTVDAQLGCTGSGCPVNGTATLSLVVPPDCTKVPAGSQAQAVNVGSPLVSKVWLVNCANPSTHQFDGSATLAVTLPLHVNDPDDENNDGMGSDSTAVLAVQDKDLTSLNAQQEPFGADLDGIALLEDRRAADPGDANNDAATQAVVPAVPGVSYEFFARAATLAVTNTGPYNLNIATSGTCTSANNDNYPEAPETAGTVNVIKAPVQATLPGPGPCTLTITATLTGGALHITDADALNQLVANITLCPDTDNDGVSTGGGSCDDDNCPTIPNPGQEDTDNDGIGDACDDTPSHDDEVKYCLKFGPAPVNLSDNGGAYMWVLCEIGNNSGHDDSVVITSAANLITNLASTPFDDDAPPGSPLTEPDGCIATTSLLIPGRTDFVLLEDEQKFVLYRTKFECHSPAVQSVVGITISVNIDHQLHVPGPDGDDTVTSNDTFTVSQNIAIGPPTPP